MQSNLPYERVDVSSLKFDPKNARKHDKRNIDAIKASLQKFGQRKPIVVLTDDTVIAGNGTLQAAIELGWETIDVSRTSMSYDEAMAYALADNRSAELATWDNDNLGSILSELDSLQWDIESLGWNDEELDKLIHTGENGTDGLTDADQVPEVEQNVYGVKLGDVWQLGNHRLMCGDSTDKATVKKLMNGEKADMVFTDPPYGMNLDTDYSKMGAAGLKHRPVIGDDKYFDPSLILAEFAETREIFLWGADYYCWSLPKAGSWIVWDKRSSNENIGQLDGAFGSSFELCWSKVKHARDIARVLRDTGCFARGDEKKVHPTQKPVKLAEWFFNKWGELGDVVADLFLGSGSTLIACEKTGRKCYGMELDEHYCSVILKRWEDFTGKKAIKLEETKS